MATLFPGTTSKGQLQDGSATLEGSDQLGFSVLAAG